MLHLHKTFSKAGMTKHMTHLKDGEDTKLYRILVDDYITPNTGFTSKLCM